MAVTKKPAAKKPVAKKPVNWQAVAKKQERELRAARREISELEYEIGVLQSIIENIEVNKSWFSRILSSLKG